MESLKGAKVTLPSDHEIVITRTFDAPRPLVFEMWTKPEHVTHWWDPGGIPLAACEIDLRPGGAFRFVHGGPDGMGRPFAGTYREIEAPSRLVFTTPSPSGGANTGILVFAAAGETTRLTLTIACTSKADRDALLAMKVDVGTVRTLDNLDTYLDSVQTGA